MGRVIKTLPDSEITVIKDKAIKARKDLSTIRAMREKCANAYSRMPLGIEKENRSQVVASSVLNHVEGVHPNLMKRYLATDHRITVVGPNEQIAKALKVWARDRITDQGAFRLMNDVIKDGMILSNGTAKVYWQRLWDKPLQGERVLTEQQMLSLAEDPEWTLQSVDPLPRRTSRVVDPGIDVSPVTGEPIVDAPTVIDVEGAQMYNCRCTHTKLLESNPVIVPIPADEFIAEHGKVRMNDRKGCGHLRTKMMAGELVREQERLSTPGNPYYSNLKVAINSARMDSVADEKNERQIREAPLWDYVTETGPDDYSSEDLRREVDVLEWSDFIVENGKLVPAIMTFCNSELIRVEENEDGIIGLMTWSPMVVSHSIFGYGAGWLHADDQNVQTILTRAVLDSIAFSIDKPRMIRSRTADLLGLQDLYPGKLVVGQEGDYKDIDVGELDFRILKAIEFLKGEAEERGPGTRYNMGTDSDSLNSTATGVSLIQRAGLNKVDMIALAFSELFLVDGYNKLIFLAQHNLDKPVEVVVDGVKVTLTRKLIQGDYRARGDLGLDVDFDDRAFEKSVGMMNIATGIAKSFPMLMPVEVAREHLRRIYVAAGEKDLSALLPNIDPMFKGWFPGRDEAVVMAAQARAIEAQQAGGGAPTPGGITPPATPGSAGNAPAARGIPPGTGSGIPDPELAGRDYVAGQSTAQPDETMMGA